MLDKIIEKIRALVEDFAITTTEVFEYTTSNIFPLQQDKGLTLVSTKINGSALASGQSADLDTSTAEVTVTASFSTNDTVTIKYSFRKFSDTEITEYIRGALAYISLDSECATDYELDDTTIYPTPPEKTQDLIAIVASVLINPNYNEFRLPTMTVKYPRTMTKEDRIRRLINRCLRSSGITDTLDWDFRSKL